MSAPVPGAVMKIADIQFHAFNPGFRNVQVVRVESDNGYYGWGEGRPEHPRSGGRRRGGALS